MSADFPQPGFELTTPADYPPRPRRIAALWRRIFAFLFDSLIVFFIGLALGYLFFDLFLNLGVAGRLVGYLVGVLYFAVPESGLGNGQSIGKRLLRLQVLDRNGNPLSVERSFLRYTIFAIPWFLYGSPFAASRTPSAIVVLLNLAVFGLGAATLYLMLFNRNTRQGVHDLAAGSYVLETGNDGPVTAHSIWKPHWTIAVAILILAAVAGTLAPRLSHQAPSPRMLSDARQVEQLPGVQAARVSRIAMHRAGVDEVSLVVNVRCTISTPDQQALANQVADSLITTDPAIDQYSTLRIVLVRGYDIGIAHSSFSQTYSGSPAEWRRQFFAVPPQTR